MEKDIAPELLEAIRERRREKEGRDPQIAAFTEKLNARKATQRDVAQYSGRLGELLSETLREILTPDNLPEGKLYYNIAARTIGPMLRNVHQMVNDSAIQAQKAIDEENGIGMKAVPAAFPEKRVNDLLYKIGSEETTPEQAQALMGEPIENNCRKFFDEHVRHNADVRFKAGLSPMIVRTVGSSEIRTSKRRKYHVPCKWCISMAGEYPYDEVNDTGNDVFRRHSGCRCIVEYVCDGKKQNVWSKKMWQADKETLEKRAAYGLERQKKKTKNRKDDRKRQELIAEYNKNREKALAKAQKRGIIQSSGKVGDSDEDTVITRVYDIIPTEASIQKELDSFIKSYAYAKEEHSMVISPSSGHIVELTGGNSTVKTQLAGEDQLLDAIVVHNHPLDQFSDTFYDSFSKKDLIFAIEYKCGKQYLVSGTLKNAFEFIEPITADELSDLYEEARYQSFVLAGAGIIDLEHEQLERMRILSKITKKVKFYEL